MEETNEPIAPVPAPETTPEAAAPEVKHNRSERRARAKLLKQSPSSHVLLRAALTENRRVVAIANVLLDRVRELEAQIAADKAGK